MIAAICGEPTDPDVAEPVIGRAFARPVGSSGLRPKGHHEMPKGVYSKWDLAPETAKVFDQSTTGELPKGRVPLDDEGVLRGHYWNGPRGEHGAYNKAVTELSDKFMRERSSRGISANHLRGYLTISK